MKITKRIIMFFAWYDLWIGLFIDHKKHNLYLCLMPCVVIKFHYGKEEESE